jgi:hypothetical protein
MLIKDILIESRKKNKTILGVGPMSQNCIDATIQISDRFEIPLQIIASRRQIDSEDFGSGYVNNWSTGELSRYVNKKSKKNLTFLSRDHGGPWQSNLEIENKLSYKEAIKSSLKSFEEDIDNGFKFLHIDPSTDPLNEGINLNDIINATCEIYSHIYDYSSDASNIQIEIGTEIQKSEINSPEEVKFVLNEVNNFCKSNNFVPPLFYVIQNGTKVLEDTNVGDYPIKIFSDQDFKNDLTSLTGICHDYGTFVKAHNSDYLSNEVLGTFSEVGIDAINIAPEFGVIETKKIVNLLKTQKLDLQLNKFLEISYSSNKWEKWLKPNSEINDYDKAILSGHYIFSSPEYIELKNEIEFIFAKKSLDFNNMVYENVYSSIERVLLSLNWKMKV